MTNGRILVVDDEPDMLEVCRDVLRRTGAEVATEGDVHRAMLKLTSESFDVAVLDMRMPEVSGMEMLKALRAAAPKTAVVVMTAFPSADTVEESVRAGAHGYLTKPFSPDQLVATVNRVLVRKRLKDVPPAAGGGPAFDDIIGTSPKMIEIFGLIEQVAPIDIDVLIVGESGSGKELVARSIHRRSKRGSHRFVPLDCGAIPEHLLESELFGHERGAFTGATSTAIGLMEFANKGVLFLDEVCELAPALQAKLLRAVQERQIRRVGGTELIRVDVRILAATNRNIDEEVRAGRFREDLFYRLNAIRIQMPPLREREGDVRTLFDHFLRLAAKEAGKAGLRAGTEVVDFLGSYPWQGNVRELQNATRRAAVVCRGDVVELKDLGLPVTSEKVATSKLSGFFLDRAIKMRDFEKDYLATLLRRHRGNVRTAAVEARLPRGTFYRLMKKYGLSAQPYLAANGHTDVNPVP